MYFVQKLDIKLLAKTEKIFTLISDIKKFQQTTILESLNNKILAWTNQDSIHTVCDLFLANMENINVYHSYVESFHLFSSLFEKINENMRFRESFMNIDSEV